MAHSLVMWVVMILGLISFGSTAYGQDFSVPPTWRKPTTSFSRGDTEEMAQSVVNSLVPLFNPNGFIPDLTFDQPAYSIAAISRTDYLSGNTTFKQLVSNSLKAIFAANTPTSTNHNSQIVMWGLASASAFRAYNDSTILGYAEASWEQVSPYQIQASDAAKGFASAVNASIPAVCNGSTTVGGVFAYPLHSTFAGASDRPTDVDGETVAAFLALSGHLYEFTNDSKYLDAATASAEFIQNHMSTFSSITDTFTVATCTPLVIPAFSYITGFTIWGLSVLATHNATWTSFLNQLILFNVPSTAWSSVTADGVVTEGPPDTNSDPVQTCLKVIWIRGLHEAWTRMDPTSDAANFIKSYLYVQFNALRDFAYTPSINAYSPIWQGPPVSQLLSWGQLDALDVLNSAFAMIPPPPSPNTTSTGANAPTSSTPADGSTETSPASTNSNSSSGSSKTPIIVGVVVGSLAAIAIGGLAAFFIIRRRKRVAERESVYDAVPPMAYVVEPYTGSRSSPAAQPSIVPEWTTQKGGYTAQSTNTASYPSPPSSYTATSARTPASQPDPEDPFARQAHLTPTTETGTYGPSPSTGSSEPALPQIIANLTNLLASMPMMRQAHEPPPQYEENDREDGHRGEM